MFDSAWRAKTTSKAHLLRWLFQTTAFCFHVVAGRTTLVERNTSLYCFQRFFWESWNFLVDWDLNLWQWSIGASKPGSCPVFNAWIRSYDRCCQKTKPCFVTLRTFFSFLFPLSTILTSCDLKKVLSVTKHGFEGWFHDLSCLVLIY